MQRHRGVQVGRASPPHYHPVSLSVRWSSMSCRRAATPPSSGGRCRARPRVTARRSGALPQRSPPPKPTALSATQALRRVDALRRPLRHRRACLRYGTREGSGALSATPSPCAAPVSVAAVSGRVPYLQHALRRALRHPWTCRVLWRCRHRAPGPVPGHAPGSQAVFVVCRTRHRVAGHASRRASQAVFAGPAQLNYQATY